MADDTSPSNKDRLTDAQRKKNHIHSERQRREAVRNGFNQLSDIVPGMSDMGRSEVKVLTATVEFIATELAKKERLASQAGKLGMSVGDFEQIYRNEEKLAEERQAERGPKLSFNGVKTSESPTTAASSNHIKVEHDDDEYSPEHD